MEQNKTTFIDQKTASGSDPTNIFQELESDLGIQSEEGDVQEKVKKHPIQIIEMVSGWILKLALVALVLLGTDVTIRWLSNIEVFHWLPSFACSYFSLGINEYDNANCLLPKDIAAEVSKSANDTEKKLAANLMILVPKKLQFVSIGNSEEVRFIREHTGNTRIQITTMLSDLQKIEDASPLKDVDCSSFSLNEKGELSMICNFYGGMLGSNATADTSSSRAAALAFLGRLTASSNSLGSSFQILEYPKTLSIEKYSSTELGIRAAFSTRTVLPLKLRYIPANLK